MPDTVEERSDDQPELGTLLELLHRANTPFTTVQATYRIWRHDERAAAAWRAEIEEQKRRGASISTYGPSSSTPAPAEHEEIVRIWRAGDHAREEHQGGPRDGSYGVRSATLWWSWDEGNGASSNEDDPTVGSGIGEELAIMLDPTPLLGSLKFAAVGRSQVAGRATITADAAPRRSDPRHGPRLFELHELGTGADRYTLQVDAQLGVLLEVVALRDGESFHKITTVEIAFDQPIPDERFRFQPPAGEDIHPISGRPRPQRLSLPEAQQLAPFTVLIPDRIPDNWHVHCIFVEPSARPPWPAQVSLNYSSDDGHESVSLSQSSAADRSEGWHDEMTSGDGWEDVVHDGTLIRVTKPGARGPQAQAHLEREGTFVFLMSETLNSGQLAALAAGLKPAPSTSSI
jgi:hypothetical protein